MSKYRILEKKKEGYYKYYTVQKKVLWLFWEDVRAFDKAEQAKAYIKDQEVIETQTVVYEE